MFPTKEKTIAPSLPCGPGFTQVLANLDTRIEFNLRPELMAAENLDAVGVARAFLNLRDIKDDMDAVQKKVSALYEEWKTVKVPEKFEQQGVPNINLEEGARVGVSHKVYASINKDKKEGAYEWLRQNDLGDLITETVNTSTLSAVAKGMAEENKELSPEFFNVAVVPNTNVVRK